MTHEEMIAVIQAAKEGKAIQQRDIVHSICPTEWKDMKITDIFNFGFAEYRVKPEKNIRPYNNVEEFLQAQEKHGMYIKIDDNHYVLPMNIIGNEVCLNCSRQIWSFEELVTKKWRDETPCGIEKE